MIIAMSIIKFNIIILCFFNSINDAAIVFNNVILNAINKLFPSKIFVSPKFPQWVSKELKTLIFKKKKAHAIYKRFGFASYYNSLSKLRAKCKYK